ncbi:MAG: DUF4252 domain-containing protein [Rhodothermales bacterium]
MRTQSLRTLLAVLLLALPLTGCFYSREISQTRRDIERQFPGTRFDRGITMSLGPGSLGALGWMAGLVPEPESQMASDYLHEISHVKVGVYRTRYLPNLDEINMSTLRRFERDGWDMAVKTQEENEVVWVFYKERYGEVRDLYVIVLTDEEMVLARIRGHLDRLLRQVMEDHHALDSIMEINVR